MNIRTVTALAALGTMLSGCATIVNGTTQSISVQSEPVQGAQCTLNNGVGTWYVVTPGSVTVHKSKTDITALCKKDGYADATQNIPARFNGATLGNVIAGGIVGIGVDAASGANYNYPALTMVSLVPVGSAPAAPSLPPPAKPAGRPAS